MAKAPVKPKSEDQKREDEILRRMLNTPPMPHVKRSEPMFFVVNGKFRVAANVQQGNDGSITADLYRNLDDYKSGQAMERAATFVAG